MFWISSIFLICCMLLRFLFDKKFIEFLGGELKPVHKITW